MIKTTKLCCGCKENKSTNLFSKNKTRSDCLQSKCKECTRKSLLEWRRNNPEIVKETRAREYRLNTEKIKDRAKNWAKLNPDKIAINSKKSRLANSDKIKLSKIDYYRNNFIRISKESKLKYRLNPEKKLKSNLLWREANSDKTNAIGARRRCSKKLACPPWFELVKHEVLSIYKEAKDLESSTGVKYHVDHLIPLQHPLVCGLHVPSNLRSITASDNLSKNNDFIPYIESELPLDSVYIHKGETLVT